ncbi:MULTISPECIES: DUF6296 family protein [Kitasatospora]|uniref:DUF6296 family protein n=1 Tax=Kitasatospora aureofaciens TaxID=1894 RepID=UPI000527107E|nr:DUF6296 family protein [Kitasatospora aureofaciens]HJD80619.1 DUF6296 family protein [Kitasatospora aureofaciens]
MASALRYAIALPGAPSTHAPPEMVVVHLTADLGPNGEPVYAARPTGGSGAAMASSPTRDGLPW